MHISPLAAQHHTGVSWPRNETACEAKGSGVHAQPADTRAEASANRYAKRFIVLLHSNVETACWSTVMLILIAARLQRFLRVKGQPLLTIKTRPAVNDRDSFYC